MMDMKERKYIKLKVDMYEDTKFKIIDMKSERDLIHYIWTRLVTLAGKVNLEGDLYLSKTIPYTIETLAIEFNRGIEQVKLALDVFIELEMVELTEGNIYRVKNFAKHQNIKVKEKVKSTHNQEDIKNKEIKLKENFKSGIDDNEVKDTKNEVNQNDVENVKKGHRGNLDLVYNDINKVDNSIGDEKINNKSQNNAPILLESKKNNKGSKNKGKATDIEFAEEATEDSGSVCFYDSDEGRPLGIGERVIGDWSC